MLRFATSFSYIALIKFLIIVIIKISTYFSEVSSESSWFNYELSNSILNRLKSLKNGQHWLAAAMFTRGLQKRSHQTVSKWTEALSQRNLVSLVISVKFRATRGLCLFKQSKPWHFIQNRQTFCFPFKVPGVIWLFWIVCNQCFSGLAKQKCRFNGKCRT